MIPGLQNKILKIGRQDETMDVRWFQTIYNHRDREPVKKRQIPHCPVCRAEIPGKRHSQGTCSSKCSTAYQIKKIKRRKLEGL